MSSLLPIISTAELIPIGPDSTSVTEKFEVRALSANDGNAFKAIRLEALQKDGNYFGTSYEEEAKRTDAQWKEKCTPTDDKCIFGMFDHQHLVGIMAVSKWDGDPKGETALWGSVYLKPSYRGMGLAAELYKARMEWTKRKGEFKSAVFFIREGNKRSTEIHEKQGAELMYIEPMRWANGQEAPARWYRKQLGF